jgi:PAS domain S-box-containing protein
MPSCEQIINMLPDPFVVIDRDYRIVAANQKYRRHYGLEADELIGRRCHEISHHSSVPCSHHGEHCPLETLFETGQPTQVMHIHYDVDGHEEWVQLSANPILDEHGVPVYMGEYIQPMRPAREDNRLLIGRSPALMRMVSLLQRVAPTQTTVLLQGESGVGKEQVAKYLHRYSERMNGPFVVVDCGVLGESLIESELFGHVKGSFTGATQHKKGLFEAAHGGTLFIDEIGELPLALQTKLLRALETSTIRPIGGTEYIQTNVRVIAATNRNLQDMVREGAFRQDLYYRLSAFPIHIPPLRDRKGDITALAEYFLSQLPEGDRHLPLTPEVIETLLLHDYPGNVRELKHIVERAAILAAGNAIGVEHVVCEPEAAENRALAEAAAEEALPSLDDEQRDQLLNRRGGRIPDEAILTALKRARGHRQQAASMLDISERTLYRHIQRLRAVEA